MKWAMISRLPKQFSGLKIFVLRLFGAKIGKHCLIEKGVKVWLPWNLRMGDFLALGRDVEIYNYGIVSIGSMTIISQYAYLCTGTHDFTKSDMPLTWEDITIGSEVWVTARVFVHPGVTIGDGAVIGACSVVTKNMPEWMICAGNPCKPIRERKINLS